jgi:hypothetical protein
VDVKAMSEIDLSLEKLTMEIKLYQHYMQTVNNGNGGHACGFYKGIQEGTIPETFEFEKGVFTIRSVSKDGKFYQWNYDPKPEVKNSP